MHEILEHPVIKVKYRSADSAASTGTIHDWSNPRKLKKSTFYVETTIIETIFEKWYHDDLGILYAAYIWRGHPRHFGIWSFSRILDFKKWRCSKLTPIEGSPLAASLFVTISVQSKRTKPKNKSRLKWSVWPFYLEWRRTILLSTNSEMHKCRYITILTYQMLWP